MTSRADGKTISALTAAMMLLASFGAQSAPIVISYDRYSGAPTIEGAKPGTEDPTSPDPAAANYSATAFFRQEVAKQTAALGADHAITFEITVSAARPAKSTRPGRAST